MLGGDIIAVLSAALPNIIGKLEAPLVINGGFNGTGALYSELTQTYASANYLAERYGTINIDASRYSPIYGNSETVQPPSFSLLPQIKY